MVCVGCKVCNDVYAIGLSKDFNVKIPKSGVCCGEELQIVEVCSNCGKLITFDKKGYSYLSGVVRRVRCQECFDALEVTDDISEVAALVDVPYSESEEFKALEKYIEDIRAEVTD